RKINGVMGKDEIKRYCTLDKQGELLLKEAYSFLNLSARAYDKILKVARTIADLKGNEYITSDDLGEAIQYRG
ncbi:MAG: magnesium chelatase, partial [Clostridia bacterium]|nr:magnesium chelatase [Clostridia bacterium]